jgi:hypothetical protein
MTLMNKRLVLITAVLAATVGSAVSNSVRAERLDAQAQAAVLLSGRQLAATVEVRDRGNAQSPSVSADAQASAAALLNGRRSGGQAKNVVRVEPTSVVRVKKDAHAQAAALLSGSRQSEEPVRTTAR